MSFEQLFTKIRQKVAIKFRRQYWEILNVGSAADKMHIYTTVAMYKMVRNFQGEWCSSIVQCTLYIKVRKNPSNLHLFFAENYQWFEICTDFCGLFCAFPLNQTFSLSGNFWRASPLSALHKNLESFWRILQKLSDKFGNFPRRASPETIH